MNCKHSVFIDNLGKPQSNREYWIITEIFTYLHGGKDFCNCDNTGNKKVIGEIKSLSI